MNEFLQSGMDARQHPDADQLNAFVERALPAHEREQTLAHLALCPECRSIVALAQASLAEPAPLQEEPERRRWHFGWKLAWPVAVALAALIPVLLYVERTAKTGGNGAPPTQVAESERPAAPSTAASPPTPVASPAPQRTPAQARPSASAAAPVAGAAPARGSAAQSATAGRAAGVASAPASVDLKNGTLGGTIDNQLYSQLPLSMNGAPRNATAFQSLMPGTASGPGNAPESATGTGAAHGNAAIYGGTGQTDLNEAYGAGAAAGAGVGRQASAASENETVSVTKTPPLMETEDATLAAPIPPIASVAPLPSGLRMISTAASGRLTLALDAAHTLFFSSDGGQHWSPVDAQWKGRVARVELAGRTAVPGAYGSAGGMAGLARGLAGGMRAMPAAGPAVTGRVTDANGATIPAASIVVRNAAKQVVREAKTDGAGRYQIAGLTPGSYDLQATAPGFEELERPVTVVAAQASVADLTLPVGAQTEAVEVTAAAAETETLATSRAMPARKTAAPPLFVVTTEAGERWTSPDGQNWTRQ